MENVIDQVFRRQSQAFKINMSYSYILQNRETGEYRFFYASNNEQLLNIPKLIRNQEDLNKLLDHLASKDYSTFLKQHSPNSKWTIERIVNLHVILYLVDFPPGRPPKLPAYIRRNRFITGLEKHTHNSQRYKDNLCFFCCLAMGKFGETYRGCTRIAQELFNEYFDHFQVDAKSFQGVRLEELPQLEQFYQVQLYAMSLQEDGTAKTLYLSTFSHPKKIYMNVYDNHLSYITDVNMYSHRYVCTRCDKLLC